MKFNWNNFFLKINEPKINIINWDKLNDSESSRCDLNPMMLTQKMTSFENHVVSFVQFEIFVIWPKIYVKRKRNMVNMSCFDSITSSIFRVPHLFLPRNFIFHAHIIYFMFFFSLYATNHGQSYFVAQFKHRENNKEIILNENQLVSMLCHFWWNPCE